MQDSITHEALEALSKKAQEPGALIADKGAFLVALETAYRTGQLIHAVPSDPWAGQAELLDECQKAASELDRQALANIRTLTDAQPSGDEVEAAARIQALETSLAEAEGRVKALTIALHDAIRRPMGQVPESADPFYSPAMAEQAEARRVARSQALSELAALENGEWKK